MPLVPMKEMLVDAKAGGYAVGTLGTVDYATAQPVLDGLDDGPSPVTIGTVQALFD